MSLSKQPINGTAARTSMLADISGSEAEKLIPRIEATVKEYNYSQTGDYRIWPGPNSNSFIAAILRTVPELGLALPPNAIGRDFRNGLYAGRTDSGTGFEFNLHGRGARGPRLREAEPLGRFLRNARGPRIHASSR